MSKFSVGEVVIFKCKSDPKLNGSETTIVSAYIRFGRQAYKCTTQGPNGQYKWWETALRKKKRKKEKTTTWSEIEKLTNWNPTKETA